MNDLARLIDEAFAAGCKGITIWRSAVHGYQANAQNADRSWCVLMGKTPSLALVRTLESQRNGPASGEPSGRPAESNKEFEDLLG